MHCARQSMHQLVPSTGFAYADSTNIPSLGSSRSEKLTMATATDTATRITRETLIDKLNEDLAREYQAIIAYVTYSQVLKGAEYMAIAAELEVHAGQEL